MFVHAAGMGGLASSSCKYEAKRAGRMAKQRKTIDFCRLLCYIKTVGLKPMVLNDGGTLWQSV